MASNNQAQITVIALVDDFNSTATTSDLLDTMVEQRREQLQTLVNSASASGLKFEIKVLIGKAFVQIIREVLRWQRDLVIKSIESTKGVEQHIFGSTDMKLLRKCPCPIWLIKSSQQQDYREILVGLDYEPENTQNDALNGQLMEMATSLALANFSELHIVHAWRLQHESLLRSPRLGNSDAEVDAMLEQEESKRRQWLAAIIDKYCSAQGKETTNFLNPQLHLLQGDAQNVVPECAKKLGAELVVVGTVGRTGIPGFIMGNTAETILNQIDTAILAIKPTGFISPVTLEE